MSLFNLWFGSFRENCLDMGFGFSSSGEREEREDPVDERHVNFDRLRYLVESPVNEKFQLFQN